MDRDDLVDRVLPRLAVPLVAAAVFVLVAFLFLWGQAFWS